VAVWKRSSNSSRKEATAKNKAQHRLVDGRFLMNLWSESLAIN